MLANPFLIYILTFGSALGIYQLGWSEIYPPTTRGLVLFFAFSFVIAGVVGRLMHPRVCSIRAYRAGLLPGWVIAVPLACFAADLVYAGSVPLIDMIRGHFHYTSFRGMPSLHVFAVTFGSVFSTIRFADFLYETDRVRWRYLGEATLPVIFLLSIVYRGPALIVLTSWVFVFVIHLSRIRISHILSMIAIGALLLLGAAKFGEARSGNVNGLGHASEAFGGSNLGPSAFWLFLYSTGPLANFQYAVSTVEPSYDLKKIPEYIVSELLPDTISHRILPRLGASPDRTIPEFSENFNVSSVFSRSWIFFGWISVLVTFAVFIFILYGYICLIRTSPLAVPSLALLNTFVVYNLFDNMIATTSIGIQLVWPLLLGLLLKKRASFEAEPLRA
ncbi:hypothetical protein [Bradyrhizobium ganzhouense]|uniref:hypothetical protein n=1 Tax=Bradyrhizobium ganzhouense TaxID=1179767 RepID=UPI003CF45C7B